MRFWIEKTLVRGSPDRQNQSFGLGKVLLSPARSQDGRDLYRFMREVSAGDAVLHLTDNEGFTMLSIAAGEVRSIYRGKEEWYIVPLENPHALKPPLDRSILFSEPYATQLKDLIEKGLSQTFFTRDLRLQQGKYLTPVSADLMSVLDQAYISIGRRSLSAISGELAAKPKA